MELLNVVMLPWTISGHSAGFVSGMALATGACRHEHWKTPAASAVPLTDGSLGVLAEQRKLSGEETQIPCRHRRARALTLQFEDESDRYWARATCDLVYKGWETPAASAVPLTDGSLR